MNMRPAPNAFPAMLRQRIEQAIEGLLQLLDAIDSHPDLEPSLGARGIATRRHRLCAERVSLDLASTLERRARRSGGGRAARHEDDPAEAGYVGEEA